MSIEKRGKKWRVCYRHNGVVYKETFDTEREAELREDYISLEKEMGKFVPPHDLIDAKKRPAEFGKDITVSELMDCMMTEYGPYEWKANTIQQYLHRIEHYIKPLIGDMRVADLTVPILEEFYRELQRMPSVDNPNKTVGLSVIEKIHNLMSTALHQAQRWGYIPRDKNTVVAYAKYPRYRYDEPNIWTPEEYQRALDVCEHRGLKLWLYLAVSCSARIGELLGLQWKDVKFFENGYASITIRQQLQRLDQKGLESSEKAEIYFKFPTRKNASTVLALCGTKDKTGRTAPPRTIFVGPAVAVQLKEEHQRQMMLRDLLGDRYVNYDLVIAQETGRPYEEHEIRHRLKKLCEENGLPVVVPHSLRHLSVTLKLLLSGDVKAVQADSGHRDARMVYDRYSHALASEREKLAQMVDERLFAGKPSEA